MNYSYKPLSKPSLYHFHGKPNEDIDSWFFTLERYFRKLLVNDKDKVDIAVDYLKEGALSTYRSMENKDYLGWQEFKNTLYSIYQSQNLQKILRKKLANLRQMNSLNEYIHSFNQIINQIKNMSEEDKIDRFTEGLNNKTAKRVAFEEPATLAEAKLLAQRIEAYFGEANFRKFENKVNRSDARYKPDLNKNQEKKKIFCYNCKNYGHHYARNCPAKSAEKNIAETSINRKEHANLIVDIFNSTLVNYHDNRLLSVKGRIGNTDVDCILDTGATRSVIAAELVEKIKIKFSKTKVKTRTANGRVTESYLSEPVEIQVCGRLAKIEFIIMQNDFIDIILGLDWLKFHNTILDTSGRSIVFKEERFFLELEDSKADIGLNLVTELYDNEDIEETEWSLSEVKFELSIKNITSHQFNKIMDYLNSIRHMFATDLKDLGTCTVKEHKIQLLSDKPVNIVPYRKSEAERRIIALEVKKMLDANIIKPSKSAWSSPVIIIPKKDGSKRICIDFRAVNKVTAQDCFPIPRIDDILDRLSGSKVFTTMDLKAGYYQVKLHKDSMGITAFTTPDGHFEFLRVPFGLKNAPADFTRIIKEVLGDLEFVEVYFDDFIIHSSTVEDHLEHIRIVVMRLESAGLKINGEKCTWFADSIKILGFIVSEKGVEMDTEKIAAINEMPYCKNVKHVQQFLGLVGYYRKFIKDFAKIAAPLYNLLKKDQRWDFNEACIQAFETLKKKLIEKPILRQPVIGRPFILYTDASGFALGAILAQIGEDGIEFIIAFWSRLLKGAEIHLGITEKECLAVLAAIKHYRVYLYGIKFQVITDHSALRWLMNITEPTGRLARWSIYLQVYDFEIIHRKGKNHSNVDALSRPILMAETVEVEDDVEPDSSKGLDPYEDEHLLHFLKFGRFKPGSSKKLTARIKRATKHFSLKDETLFYRKDAENKEFSLMVPRPEQREEIILKAHLLGHFQAQSTYDRLKTNYYWKNMLDDIKKTISKCLPCIRHQKTVALNIQQLRLI